MAGEHVHMAVLVPGDRPLRVIAFDQPGVLCDGVSAVEVEDLEVSIATHREQLAGGVDAHGRRHPDRRHGHIFIVAGCGRSAFHRVGAQRRARLYIVSRWVEDGEAYRDVIRGIAGVYAGTIFIAVLCGGRVIAGSYPGEKSVALPLVNHKIAYVV